MYGMEWMDGWMESCNSGKKQATSTSCLIEGPQAVMESKKHMYVRNGWMDEWMHEWKDVK